MKSLKNTRPRASLQAGFTLVELMVSLVIGLFIMLGMVTLLSNVSSTNTEMTKTNRLIENGRFAMLILEKDIQHAGFWGGFVPAFEDLGTVGVPGDVPTAVPNPCALDYAALSAADQSNLIGISVQSHEISGATPASPVCSSVVTSAKAATDVLVVRHVATCTAGSGTGDCAAQETGALYFQMERCGNVAPTVPYRLATTGLTGKQRNCTTAAELRKFVSSLFYIRNYAVTAGDGIPTLMRSQFGLSGSTLGYAAAQPLIEGIEGFRIELGIDDISRLNEAVDYSAAVVMDTTNTDTPKNRGDGVPDGDATNGYDIRCTAAVPCTAAQLMNAVVLKLYVLVRSDVATPGYTDAKTYTLGTTTMGPFNDGFRRHLFSQTIRLNNVAMRRETPS